MTLPLKAPYGAIPPRGLRRPQSHGTAWVTAHTVGSDPASRRERRGHTRRARKVLNGLALGPGLPCRVHALEDLSGSMGSIAAVREVVFSELLRWLGSHLQAEDEIAVTSFAGDASVRLAPTSARSKLQMSPPRLTSYATLLGPAWDLIGTMPAFEPADSRGVRMIGRSVAVLVSDGLVADLHGKGGETGARTVGLDGEVLLLPTHGDSAGLQVPRCWTTGFPHSSHYVVDATDAGALAFALARAIADLTGRTLKGPADSLPTTGIGDLGEPPPPHQDDTAQEDPEGAIP